MQAHVQLNTTRRFRSKPVLTVKSIAVRGVSPLVRKLASNAQAEEVEEGRGGSHSSGSPASEEFIPLDARQRQQAVNRSQAFLERYGLCEGELSGLFRGSWPA